MHFNQYKSRISRESLHTVRMLTNQRCRNFLRFMSDHLKIWDGNEACLNQIRSTSAEVHWFYMASDFLESEKLIKTS